MPTNERVYANIWRPTRENERSNTNNTKLKVWRSLLICEPLAKSTNKLFNEINFGRHFCVIRKSFCARRLTIALKTDISWFSGLLWEKSWEVRWVIINCHPQPTPEHVTTELTDVESAKRFPTSRVTRNDHQPRAINIHPRTSFMVRDLMDLRNAWTLEIPSPIILKAFEFMVTSEATWECFNFSRWKSSALR